MRTNSIAPTKFRRKPAASGAVRRPRLGVGIIDIIPIVVVLLVTALSLRDTK